MREAFKNENIFEILKVELFKIKPNLFLKSTKSNINKKLTKGAIKNKPIRPF